MDGVAHCSDQDTKLIATIDVLLLETENHWTQVIVIGEIIPVFSAVKILFIRGLNHARQLEAAVFTPVLLDDGLFA